MTREIFRGLLLASVFAATATVTQADPLPAPAPSATPRATVTRILDGARQALLFDRVRAEYVVVKVDDRVQGFRVLSIEEDQIVLEGVEPGRLYVLPVIEPLPAPGPIDPYGSTSGPRPTASTPASPRPLDPAPTAGPLDPYAPRSDAATSPASGPLDPYAPEPDPTLPAAGSLDPAAPREAPTSAAPAPLDPYAPRPGSPTSASPGPLDPAVPATSPGSSTPGATAPVDPYAPPPGAPTTAGPGAPPRPSPSSATPTPPAPPTSSAIGSRATRITNARVRRGDLDAALADFSRLGREIEIEQASGGVRLTRVADQSLVARLGLRAGDLVREVAGRPLASLEDAAAVYAEVANAQKVDILFERGGVVRVLRVTVGR